MPADPPGGPSDPLLGRVLDGRYRVEERIGRGGMGEIYRALHLMMERRVAVKVLNPDRAGDPDSAQRFIREARQTFRFDHQNCLRVLDFGATEDGVLYLVMEYLDGRTVGQELHVDGPIAPGRVAHICAQVCDALAHAHGLGIVHRDLKPENVMLLRREGDPDFAKVLDFGLAKIYDAQSAPGTILTAASLTREGMVFGTPEYMSPEQASGGELQPATDIYAVGAVAYQMLTGRVPFEGPTFMAILKRHVKEAPVPPSERRPDLGIPEGLERLVLACLAKVPSQRPAGARELARSFRELEAQDDRGARVPRNVAASETMDLGPSGPSGPATRPAVPGAAPAAEAPPSAAISSTTRRDRRYRAQVAAAVAGVLALLGGGTVGLFAWLGGDRPAEQAASSAPRSEEPDPRGSGTAAETGERKAASEPETESVSDPPTGRDLEEDTDTGLRPDAGVDQAAAPRTAASGGEAKRGRSARGSRESGSRRGADARLAAKHVAKSAAARRAGNHLRQLAHADKARKLDPENRRALFLFADALVSTGQKDKGCRYLKRWPRRYREAGCTD